MKPRVFIGSSVESLDIAYLIQENLEYDGLITIWTQGIFQLSSNTLDDLIVALQNFDFAIFVFQPDDITKIRNAQFETVRDNIIFELGLFIGKLGKNKVFFVIPNNTENLHLPTDLLGVMPGKYDANRQDKNLKAALGPFCNQVRIVLSKFKFENLLNFENETERSKFLAIKKPESWEFLLTSELLKTRLIEINRKYLELEKGLVFKPSRKLDILEFLSWVRSTTTDILRLINIFKKIFEEELPKAFGEPGVPGNVYEIKYCVDKIAVVCNELLTWEYDVQSLDVQAEIKEAVDIMKGWTKIIINEINRFPILIDDALKPENLDGSKHVDINLTFEAPSNIDKVLQLMEEAVDSHINSQ
jgi:Predicted nucleotide-binding protein containing TIR-like domain